MESILFLVHELKLLHLTTQFQSSCWCQNSHRQSVEITEIAFCKGRSAWRLRWSLSQIQRGVSFDQISVSDFQDPNGIENTKRFHRPIYSGQSHIIHVTQTLSQHKSIINLPEQWKEQTHPLFFRVILGWRWMVNMVLWKTVEKMQLLSKGISVLAPWQAFTRGQEIEKKLTESSWSKCGISYVFFGWHFGHISERRTSSLAIEIIRAYLCTRVFRVFFRIGDPTCFFLEFEAWLISNFLCFLQIFVTQMWGLIVSSFNWSMFFSKKITYYSVWCHLTCCIYKFLRDATPV